MVLVEAGHQNSKEIKLEDGDIERERCETISLFFI